MTENYNYQYIQNTPQEIYTTNDDINQLLNQYPTTTDYTTTYQSPQNYTVTQNPQKVQQQIGEIIKKFKLTVEKPSVQALAECIAKVEAPAPES